MRNWIFESKLEEFPNQEWLGIHTRAPLTTHLLSRYSSTDRDKGYNIHLNPGKGFTILTQALISGIEQIPGVLEVGCRRNMISIKRSMAYTWDELLEKMVPIFVSYCPTTY